MSRRILWLAVGFLFLLGTVGHAGEELVLKGSTTVLPIAQLAAEAFHGLRPEVKISVAGGGSGVGIAALIDGVCDIALASRAMKPAEWEKAVAAGVYPFHWYIATDGIAVVVHPTNPIDRLTTDQIRAIYTGEIRNWAELGGPDLPIVVVSRDTASGTFEVFKKLVLKGEEVRAPGALFQPSNAAVLASVAPSPGAIGYIGLGYLTADVKALAIATDPAGPFVAPSTEAVVSGAYPLTRPLFMITNGFPTGVVKEFISFVLSDEGQRLVAEAGYIPIRPLGPED
ncbi:phosphate ABC transporter substrate-binding protein [Candidatus Bipolaricaulota sp. J31]